MMKKVLKPIRRGANAKNTSILQKTRTRKKELLSDKWQYIIICISNYR